MLNNLIIMPHATSDDEEEFSRSRFGIETSFMQATHDEKRLLDRVRATIEVGKGESIVDACQRNGAKIRTGVNPAICEQ